MSSAVTEANTLTRQLWHIAGTGDLEQLDELLAQGANVNAGDRTGVTALMRAAYHGQLAMVRALIFYGADPGAKDRSGLTALMMAEYGGHEEIVEALRLLRGQGKREIAQESRPVASVTEENVDVATDYEDSESSKQNVVAATDYDDGESGKDSETARTLHEPPEIWELVHTTQTGSYSPSPSRGKIFSPRILALAVGALIICAGAVFGFIALRGAMSATGETSQQQPSSNQQLSASKSLTNASARNARSSNELTKLKPVGKPGGERVDPPTVASSVSSAKKLSVSPRPKATKVSATIAKQNQSVRRATKLEGEQDASAKSAKKEPAPPASDPVKPSTTQKPKVIPWP